jgi:hypothetical protein
MYDVASKSVSHLNGELSTKFVNVAEENANAQDESSLSQIDRIDTDIEPDSSDTVETVLNLSGNPVSYDEKKENQVLISSGYSVIKNE